MNREMLPEEASIVDQSRLADYQSLQLLGQGGWGRVWLCRNNSLPDRPFAVKVVSKAKALKKGNVMGLLNERRLTLGMDHPFIVKMYRTFECPRSVYMLCEFVPGGDLFHYLQVVPRASEPMVAFISAQVVLAFQFLHSKGVVYRDLKPENLMIDAQGYIKLVDFGLAVLGGNGLLPNGVNACCTPDYMAPESLTSRQCGAATDWWSLGVLIYEMLYGRAPFHGATDRETYENIARGQIPVPHGMTHLVMDVLMRLLKGDPMDRLGREVAFHKFYQHIDWHTLYNRGLASGLVLDLASPFDTRHFPQQQVPRADHDDPSIELPPEAQALFSEFSGNESDCTAQPDMVTRLQQQYMTMATANYGK